jgi:hypothetical protein
MKVIIDRDSGLYYTLQATGSEAVVDVEMTEAELVEFEMVRAEYEKWQDRLEKIWRERVGRHDP